MSTNSKVYLRNFNIKYINSIVRHSFKLHAHVKLKEKK